MTAQTKKLVFCFDGTSNTLDIPHPTNVAITAAAVRNTSKTGPQIVYYDEGVGSTQKDNFLGGTVGMGLYDKVIEAYKFLVFNHEPGDEIFIFGFSRGAYTARSFAGLIHNIGVVNSCFADRIRVAATLYRNRDNDTADEVRRFRSEFAPDVCASPDDLAWRIANIEGFDAEKASIINVRYIGVWDTVKSIGDPLLGDKDGDGEYDAAEFHDHNLHPSVESARHAIAIDERRKKFDVTPWDNVDNLNEQKNYALDDPERPYQQLWFPGDHGSVGGGGDVRGLSDEGLEWVLDGAKKAGLALDIAAHSKVWSIQPDVLAPLENSSEKSWRPRDVAMRMLPKKDRNGPSAIHEVSRAAIVRWGAPAKHLPEKESYRPSTLEDVAAFLDLAAADLMPWEYEARGGFAPPQSDPDRHRASDGRDFPRYVVTSGDSLPKIAKNLLGNAKRADDILALNRTTVMDLSRLYVGQVLNLPEDAATPA